MTRIPDNIKDRLRDETDIVTILARELPHLKRRGSIWTCCCPFHEEKIPSFTVSPRKQTFHCYGGSCGAGGDVFKFFMLRDRLTFPEAVRHVAHITNNDRLLPKE